MPMNLYRTTKKVLSVINNSEQFLNGLTANSLDKPQNAFVNIHGRIISTFDQLKVSDDKYLLVVEEAFVQVVLNHVDRYARLNKTILRSENFFVYFDLDDTYVPQLAEFIIPQKRGQLILTAEHLPASVDENEFTIFRLDNNIPLLGVDYKDEMLLNVSETDFVSFTKGCFLGQEPLAKVHHRSKPSWTLKVKFAQECSVEEELKMTSQITDPVTGRVRGFVFVANN